MNLVIYLFHFRKFKLWGPYPQYTFNTTNKDPQNISGYTISYSNDETNKLFKKIQKICTKKLENLKLKPVFIENKDKKETAYFKLKMTGKYIATDFYVDI